MKPTSPKSRTQIRVVACFPKLPVPPTDFSNPILSWERAWPADPRPQCFREAVEVKREPCGTPGPLRALGPRSYSPPTIICISRSRSHVCFSVSVSALCGVCVSVDSFSPSSAWVSLCGCLGQFVCEFWVCGISLSFVLHLSGLSCPSLHTIKIPLTDRKTRSTQMLVHRCPAWSTTARLEGTQMTISGEMHG